MGLLAALVFYHRIERIEQIFLLAALEEFFCPRIFRIKWIIDLYSAYNNPCNPRMFLLAALEVFYHP